MSGLDKLFRRRPYPPVDPGPQVRPVTILVQDEAGQPLQGVDVALTGERSAIRLNGVNGGVTFELFVPDTIAVSASKPGYVSYVGTYSVGGGDEIRIALPKVVTPAVKPPSVFVFGSQFRDARTSRLWIPRAVSMLSALRPTRTEADWRAFAGWAISKPFNAVRVFAGDLPWADGQTAEQARDRLPRYLDVMAEYGLAVFVAAVTESGSGRYDWRAHVREVLGICDGRTHVLVSGFNEGGHPTQVTVTPDDIAATMRAFPGAWSPGGMLGWDEPKKHVRPDGSEWFEWPLGQGKFDEACLDRGRESWERDRRVRELFAVVGHTRKPCWNVEPIGADELDGSVTGKQRTNDPAAFAVMGALEAAFPGVGGCHHSQAGLHAVLPGPVQDRSADAHVRAHLAVRSVLGDSEGRYYNIGHVGSPLQGYIEAEQTRYYCFKRDDHTGVGVQIGTVANPTGLVWADGWHEAEKLYEQAGHDGRLVRVWRLER